MLRMNINETDFLNKLPDFLHHPWTESLIIVVAYWLAAILIDLVVCRVIKKATSKTATDLDDHLVDLAHAPIIWSLVIYGVEHALARLAFSDSFVHVFDNISSTLVVVIWLIALVKLSNFFFTKAQFGWAEKIGQDIMAILNKLVFLLIVICGLYWMLGIWGVSITPLFASAGIAGIAVAMAAKDTLANFFGGMSLFADSIFKVGDYIIVDGEERGEVVELGMRSTRVLTRDDVMVTIPNSILANSKIVNESAPEPKFRIKIPVGVAYGSDLDQVEELLLGVAKSSSDIVSSPAPRVRVRAMADSSINMDLMVWVKDPRDRGMQIHLFLKNIYTVFNDNNVSIPFPQMDVHLEKQSISE